jgi:hypothetical protein
MTGSVTEQEQSEQVVFSEPETFEGAGQELLHGFAAHRLEDVGDLCDADCVDCD